VRRHAFAHALTALASTGLAGASIAADIVITPPAAGGVTITNAIGNANRLRVGEDGSVTVPGGMRIQPGAEATTVILGRDENTAAAEIRAATIAGGGGAGNAFNFGTLAYPCPSGCGNAVYQHGGFVGGGAGNQAGGIGAPPTDGGAAAVVGGISNIAEGGLSGIVGGWNNRAVGKYSFVGGGQQNQAVSDASVIAGGGGNNASGSVSAIGGGSFNSTAGIAATVPGGHSGLLDARSAVSWSQSARAA